MLEKEKSLRSRTPVENEEFYKAGNTHYVNPVGESKWTEFPPNIIELIEDECDIVVRFGFGLIRGDILEAAEYGVLSYHPADVKRYRGLGPVMAYFDNQAEIRPTLQRLNEKVDRGEIICQGCVNISETDTLWDVYEKVYDSQESLLAEGVKKAASADFQPEKPEELGDYNPLDKTYECEIASTVLLKNMVSRVRRYQ
nr:formyltransferase family protein [Natrialba sp. INN-245]